MTTIIRAILLAVLITSLFILPPYRAHACSCIPPAPPAEARDEATAVFAGKVVGIEAPGGLTVSSTDPVRVTFEVSELWKGPAGSEIQVSTMQSSASCGYEFTRGERYLVYARGDQVALETGLCSRTTVLDGAEEDLAALGAGQPPPESATPENAEQGVALLSPPVLLLGLAGLFLLAAAGVVFKRRAT